jgi:kumamolisin
MTLIRSILTNLRSSASIGWFTASVIALFLSGSLTITSAQTPSTVPSRVTIPASSVPGPGDAGIKVHTNLQFIETVGFNGTVRNYASPYGPGLYYETPASIACLYGLQPPVAGCNPDVASVNPNGGSRAIAIVDAYDNPTAPGDLQNFSAQFGVGAGSFSIVYAPPGAATPGSCNGAPVQPASAAGTGWDIEASLDVQWAHAMAPSATLFLVEAQSNSFADLLCAVSVASNLVAGLGGGQVSMSWGSSEFPDELSIDPVFTTPNVVYFASAGDYPGVSYPSASPNVISVGGTTLSRNPLTGNFRFENTWQNTGGGASYFEPRPPYQNGIAAILSPSPGRGTPDVAADANPTTGAWVYNSSYCAYYGYSCTWFIVGGTSLSSPLWAGIANAAGGFSPSSTAELTKLYADPPGNFNDITIGVCGPYMGAVAAAGWDLCSGRGSVKSYAGK